MNKHGVYVSFAVLVESAALLLGCLLVVLAVAHLAGIVVWLLLALLLAAAVVYGCWLWSIRGQNCYGLWELEEEEVKS
jgi:hypothetical protein